MRVPDWWTRPRRITVLVDNPSWVLPFAQRLVEECRTDGDDALLARTHDDMREGGVAFLIGCTRLVPPPILARHQRNLVVHASDLPRGRGFSPLAWQIEEGHSRIPICLLDAALEADAGAVVYRDAIDVVGNELLPELREALGSKTLELCRRFLAEPIPPDGTAQTGEGTHYRRRTDADNRLDPNRSLADQFDKLRVVDNDRYPAHFEFRGRRYRLRIDIPQE